MTEHEKTDTAVAFFKLVLGILIGIGVGAWTGEWGAGIAATGVALLGARAIG